jgi:hypothetical protein
MWKIDLDGSNMAPLWASWLPVESEQRAHIWWDSVHQAERWLVPEALYVSHSAKQVCYHPHFTGEETEVGES